jgi:hypothetical protein
MTNTSLINSLHVFLKAESWNPYIKGLTTWFMMKALSAIRINPIEVEL